MSRFSHWLFQSVRLGERTINSREQVIPHNYMSNKVNNQKYNIITLVPKFLYNEYKYFCNFYFLFAMLLQLYEPFRVGLLITHVGPIAVVTGLSFIKELWDEYKKGQKDAEFNRETYV